MESLTTFFAMGGYGAFVWPSFAVTAIVMIGLLVLSLRTLRANEAALGRLEGNGEEDPGS